MTMDSGVLAAAAAARINGGGSPTPPGPGGPSPLGPNPMNPMAQPQMLPPQLPPELMPNSWDNHEAHIFYHNQYRKSQEFESLPDHVKQIFEQHVNMHQQALQFGVQPAGGGGVIGGQQQLANDPSQQMNDQQAQDVQQGG